MVGRPRTPGGVAHQTSNEPARPRGTTPKGWGEAASSNTGSRYAPRVTQSPTGLKPPHSVTAHPRPGGGWRTIVQWEYDFRFEEIKHFAVHRRRQGSRKWEVIAEGISNTERSYADTLPDEAQYTYRVEATPVDGGPPMRTIASASPARDGERSIGSEPGYVTAAPQSAAPTNIHKPLRSTDTAMFVAWNKQVQAAAYLLEALNDDGSVRYRTHVPDPDVPLGLLVGSHPDHLVTVKVTVLRHRPDGSLYPAASATETLTVDHVRRPHLGVVEFGYDSDTGFSTGAVVALHGEGPGVPALEVNGSCHTTAWTAPDSSSSAAVVLYTMHGRSAVTAFLSSPTLIPCPGPAPATSPS